MAKDWATVRNRLGDENKKRNKIAHGSIVSPVSVMSGPPVVLPVWVPFFDENRYKLFKAVPSHDRGKARTFEELSSADLAVIRQGFIRDQHLLSSFF